MRGAMINWPNRQGVGKCWKVVRHHCFFSQSNTHKYTDALKSGQSIQAVVLPGSANARKVVHRSGEAVSLDDMSEYEIAAEQVPASFI